MTPSPTDALCAARRRLPRIGTCEDSLGSFAVPAAADTAGSAVVKSNPASAFVASHLGDAQFEGGAANWLELRGAFGTSLDDAMLGKKSVQETLTSLEQQSK